MAKNSLITHIAQAGWPQKHIKALSLFFINLEMSPLRLEDQGEKVLLLYQARVRLHWHDALKRDEGYNIGDINDKLLQSISREVIKRSQHDTLRRVSLISLL